MYNVFGNEAEVQIRKSYDSYFEDMSKVRKLKIKTTPHYRHLLEVRKNSKNQEVKQPYKMKMFMNVGSKVMEGLTNFKTYKHQKSEKKLE